MWNSPARYPYNGAHGMRRAVCPCVGPGSREPPTAPPGQCPRRKEQDGHSHARLGPADGGAPARGRPLVVELPGSRRPARRQRAPCRASRARRTRRLGPPVHLDRGQRLRARCPHRPRARRARRRVRRRLPRGAGRSRGPCAAAEDRGARRHRERACAPHACCPRPRRARRRPELPARSASLVRAGAVRKPPPPRGALRALLP